MPKICEKCNKEFNFSTTINGKKRNLASRKYCLECSPFDTHNTVKLNGKPRKTDYTIDQDLRNLRQLDKNGTRTCKLCRVNKSIDDFYTKTNKTKHPSHCKECFRAMAAEKKNLVKQKLLEPHGAKCKRCGYNKCFAALDFHHLDPANKEFELARIYNWTAYAKYSNESLKCVVLCAICHREFHAGLFQIDKDKNIIEETA